MRYSSFFKRVKAYLFDYLILSIPIMIVTFMIVLKFLRYTSSLNVYPFILLMLMYCPYFILGFLIKYPIKNDVVLVLVSIVIIVILESIIYTIMEFFFNGQTIGKKKNNIYLYNKSIFKIFIMYPIFACISNKGKTDSLWFIIRNLCYRKIGIIFRKTH